VITTNTITDTGSYLSSETLYDSMGEVVETQAETPDGGRNIADTTYNSDGLIQLVSNSYYTSGRPTTRSSTPPLTRSPARPGTSTTATAG
jgi:hypothetical protein